MPWEIIGILLPSDICLHPVLMLTSLAVYVPYETTALSVSVRFKLWPLQVSEKGLPVRAEMHHPGEEVTGDYTVL